MALKKFANKLAKIMRILKYYPKFRRHTFIQDFLLTINRLFDTINGIIITIFYQNSIGNYRIDARTSSFLRSNKFLLDLNSVCP